MKISRIDIPADVAAKVGLKAIKMERLGPMVFLAGRNGSGKSRLLGLLQKILIGLRNSARKLAQAIRLPNMPESSLQFFLEEIEKRSRGITEPSLHQYLSLFLRARDSIKLHSERASEFPGGLQRVWAINFVPRAVPLEDPDQRAWATVTASAKSTSQLGVGHLPQSCLAKIRVAQNLWLEATHQNSPFPEEHKQRCIRDYDKLRELIREFLGTELDRDTEMRPDPVWLTSGPGAVI